MNGRVAAVIVAVALVAAAPAGAAKPKAAPQISGVTIEGQWLDLRAFRGRPIFVNIWAST